jgi:hypothetical protein
MKKNSPKGEKQFHSKLTDNKVNEIRRAYITGEKLNDIQNRFGVSFRTITGICYGESWKHLLGANGSPSLDDLRNAKRDNRAAIITPDDVREIRRLCELGVPSTEIQNRYHISRQNIYSIKTRRSWRSVSD